MLEWSATARPTKKQRQPLHHKLLQNMMRSYRWLRILSLEKFPNQANGTQIPWENKKTGYPEWRALVQPNIYNTLLSNVGEQTAQAARDLLTFRMSLRKLRPLGETKITVMMPALAIITTTLLAGIPPKAAT